MIDWSKTHIERHRMLHEQQMQIKEQVRLLAVAIGATVVAFLLGLYLGSMGR